jgi:hypothetical protein
MSLTTFAVYKSFTVKRFELCGRHFHAAMGLDWVEINLSHEPFGSIHLDTPIKEVLFFILFFIGWRRYGHDFRSHVACLH